MLLAGGDSVNVGLAVIAIVAVAGALAVGLSRRAQRRADAALVRRLGLPPGTATGAAIDHVLEETEERVAGAEAMQHWLVGALDQATDAIVVVDRIGREVVRNAAARRFEGARHGDALAEEAIVDVLQRALRGRDAEREIQLYGPPRQVLLLRAYTLRTGGEVTGAVAFTRDISESRRVESVRRDFVANVSHELKTPIGALGLLAETMATSDDPKVMRPLADRVLREADRLARLVDDLLNLSNIEAQEAPVRAPLPVALLLAEAIDHVQAAADVAGVPVRLVPEAPDIEINCHHRQLRSAFVNLLDNAIKYSTAGDVVEVGARVEGERVALSVRDHGHGIPTRDLERIFERFYRVDRARSRETGGTGLGLAIVRHVVQAHGGEVKVESREGEGSTFTLYLPITNGGQRTMSEAS
ncbi:MAG: sensor histidine kinase [Actinomycetota bacterium]